MSLLPAMLQHTKVVSKERRQVSALGESNNETHRNAVLDDCKKQTRSAQAQNTTTLSVLTCGWLERRRGIDGFVPGHVRQLVHSVALHKLSNGWNVCCNNVILVPLLNRHKRGELRHNRVFLADGNDILLGFSLFGAMVHLIHTKVHRNELLRALNRQPIVRECVKMTNQFFPPRF